ncbi:MAG: YIP1 family protein [Bacteroidota bacterium]|jgi:hypothetical protein
MFPLIYFLHRPAYAIEQLKMRPQWLIAFLVLAALSVLRLVYNYPAIVAATLDHLPPSAMAADKLLMQEHLAVDLYARAFFLPIRLLAGWSVFALLLYELSSWVGSAEPVHFRQLFALEVHAESVLLLGGCLEIVLHHGSGVSGMPLSAATFLHPQSGIVLASILESLNPFTAWYVALLGLGVRIFCRFSVLKATAVAVTAWIVTLIWNLAIFKYLAESFHLMV